MVRRRAPDPRRPPGPGGSRSAGRTSSGGWCGCWAATATPTPATSTAPCSSSSSGGPPRKSSPTRWPGSAPPKVTEKLIPVFTSGELSALEKACAGRSFAQRRDAGDHRGVPGDRDPAVGAGRDPLRPRRRAAQRRRPVAAGRSRSGARAASRGSSGSATRPPARLDRYLRVRARHAQAYRPQLWLGVNNRGPMTANGIYQMIVRRGPPVRGGGVPAPVPAPFQPHLAGPRRRRGRPDGAERLVLPADAAPLRRQRPQRPGPPHLRPHHGPTGRDTSHDRVKDAPRPGPPRRAAASDPRAAVARQHPARRMPTSYSHADVSAAYGPFIKCASKLHVAERCY